MKLRHLHGKTDTTTNHTVTPHAQEKIESAKQKSLKRQKSVKGKLAVEAVRCNISVGFGFYFTRQMSASEPIVHSEAKTRKSLQNRLMCDVGDV